MIQQDRYTRPRPIQLLMIGDAGKQAEPECAELEREHDNRYSEAGEPPDAGSKDEGLHNGEARG